MDRYLKLQKHKNFDIYVIILLFLVTLMFRIPLIEIYGDTSLQYEWTKLVKNLVENNKLVWKTIDGVMLPNLWVPPLYAYFIYIFTFFNLEGQNLISAVIFTQIFLSSITVIFFYKLNKFFFNKLLSLISALIFSLFPLYAYASTQISSITLQVFFTILFIFYLFSILKSKNISNVILFSIVGGFLVLLRGEFYAIFFISILYLLFKKVKIKNIVLIILVALLITSPYLVRNYIIFEKVTVLNSFGYNVWKGNHPIAMEKSIVAGMETRSDEIQKKVDEIPKDLNYRFRFNEIFFQETIQNFQNNPLDHLLFIFKKAISFILIDFNSLDKNYYNPWHFIPVLLVGLISVIGVILSDKKSHNLNFLILILIIYIGIYSLVSIMPRYKLMILPIQLIFFIIALNFIFKKLKKK